MQRRRRLGQTCLIGSFRSIALKRLVCLAALLVVDVVDGAAVAGAANLVKFGKSSQLILGFGAPKIFSLPLPRPELPGRRAQGDKNAAVTRVLAGGRRFVDGVVGGEPGQTHTFFVERDSFLAGPRGRI